MNVDNKSPHPLDPLIQIISLRMELKEVVVAPDSRLPSFDIVSFLMCAVGKPQTSALCAFPQQWKPPEQEQQAAGEAGEAGGGGAPRWQQWCSDRPAAATVISPLPGWLGWGTQAEEWSDQCCSVRLS